MNCYRANGKLLLTGEYLVLKGALALALPLGFGQSLTVRHCEQSEAMTKWNAHRPFGRPWFSATFDKDFKVLATDDTTKAQRLSNILKAVHKLNPSAFNQSLHFETCLDFDPEWGLGSSSTLISNLAQWANVNPYKLLNMTFGGSGYDIACATAETPIFYQLNNGKPQVSPVAFNPKFADQLYFIYQGQKQQSSKEVKSFNQRMLEYDFHDDLESISEISRKLPAISTLAEFRQCIDTHEAILARCLDREPVKAHFLDFEGSLKSLGAWGGDFLLAATDLPYKEVLAYFNEKGLSTIFKYQDLIL